MQKVWNSFSLLEKTLSIILLAAAVIAAGGLLAEINAELTATKPWPGGKLTEAVVKGPHMDIPGVINPLLAVQQSDKDLTSLIYGGLVKPSPRGGYQPELAESYQADEEYREFTFTLRDNLNFHDGVPVTAEDVKFTAELAANPISRVKNQWQNIETEVIDRRTVKFILPESNPDFLSTAAIGILPKHIWEEVGPEGMHMTEHNQQPTGSGPYRLKESDQEDQSYRLEAFNDYALGAPYLQELKFKFYPSEQLALEALYHGEVDTFYNPTPTLADDLPADTNVHSYLMPRVFAVFFNQNRNEVLANREVRKALRQAIDKDQLVDDVLNGHGSAVESLIPQQLETYLFHRNSKVPRDPVTADRQETDHTATSTEIKGSPEIAAETLESEGWELNEDGIYENDDELLSFELTLPDIAELRTAARILADNWNSLGAEVVIRTRSDSLLYQEIIPAREYDALLHGYSLGRNFDLYPFWHSSEQNDPGLNAAQYASIEADNLLEELRSETEPEKREELYRRLHQEISEYEPALFLYSPEYLYLTPKQIKDMEFQLITAPEERFTGVHQWYLNTETVWTNWYQEPPRQ